VSAPLTRTAAEDLLYREALLIDTQRFAEWLELFTPEVEFWMPAWRDENSVTEDPDRELSLIYYKGRRNLIRGVYQIDTRGWCHFDTRGW
jgi:benzoate/toluate 1,2-dioxygenase beta subunit